MISNVPTWARWMIYATIGVFALTVVQEISDTGRLTATSTSQAMVRWAIPILLAGLGGMFSERAGVVNIGLEGMMILGTWFGAWGAINYGAWGGIAIGVAGGALGGLLHALATVTFGVDQIVSGVAINILAPGIARFLSSEIFSGYAGGSITQSPSLPATPKLTMPILAGGDPFEVDLLGDLARKEWFFISDLASLLRGLMLDMSGATLLALVLVPVSGWVLWRTRFGLRMRMCGEAPGAAETQGIAVERYKYIGVIISGGLAGMAGAFIASPEMSGIYSEGQTQGRGFIGLAAVIFGNWRPGGILSGSLLFGYPFGLKLRDLDGAASHALLLFISLAMLGVVIWSIKRKARSDVILASIIGGLLFLWYLLSDTVPGWWSSILPYVIVLVVLVFFSQRLRPPAALGEPYKKGAS